jgi:4-hydroxy-L-threonine phosphate dehydrogenase PdxA
LRVALATTHLPLRDVADAITPASLTRTLQSCIRICGRNSASPSHASMSAV